MSQETRLGGKGQSRGIRQLHFPGRGVNLALVIHLTGKSLRAQFLPPLHLSYKITARIQEWQRE